MHLLNTVTAQLRQFASSRDVQYAIVSHVWQASPKEQTFHEVRDIPRRCEERKAAGEIVDPRSFLSAKLRACCRVAQRAGYEWIWVDTCCIDHNSSAELSEAINSMFMWYADAQVCYAYLHDVGDDEDPSSRGSAFRRSVWHSRGWTLQELLAPACVIFLSRTWRTLGSKYSLALALVEVTGIRHDILTRAQSNWLEKASVAERMSWAAHRRTTRVEDRAYSLMGIFGINMPTIYGEGPRAFIRLQEEILRRIPDQSIFAWGRIHSSYYSATQYWLGNDAEGEEGATTSQQEDPKKTGPPVHGSPIAPHVQARLEDLLASSPSDFANCAGIKVLSIPDFGNKLGMEGKVPQYTFTSYGTLVQLYMTAQPIDSGRTWAERTGTTLSPRPTYAAILACTNEDKQPIVLLLRPSHHAASLQYSVGEFVDGVDEESYYRCALYPELLVNRKNPYAKSNDKHKPAKWVLQEMYIRHDYSTLTLGQAQDPVRQPDVAPVITFHIPQWRLNALLARYHLNVRATFDDGLTLRIPYDTHTGSVEHATSSAHFVHTVLGEILTMRIGVGCSCTPASEKLPEGDCASNFWVDVRVARVAEPGHAQSYGQVLPHVFPAASSNIKSLCGRAHLRNPEGVEESTPVTLVFGDDDRKVQLRITYAEGFDPVGASLRTSYMLSLELSGTLYERAMGVTDSGVEGNLTNDLETSAALVDAQSVDATTQPGYQTEQQQHEITQPRRSEPSSPSWAQWLVRGLRLPVTGPLVTSSEQAGDDTVVH